MMKKLLFAGAVTFAFTSTAMAQSSINTGAGTSSSVRTQRSDGPYQTNPNAAGTTGSAAGAKRGVPGNDVSGGDASQSSPKSTVPGAAKAGGG